MITIIAGCGTLGNGKLDIPEVEVGWVSPTGTEYHFGYDKETGIAIEGAYTDPNTGIKFVIKDSVLTATHPTGVVVRYNLPTKR